MKENGKYHINFFRPHTPFLKDNIRLIAISITVWAIAVFGFHILLKIVEKPVPEPGYVIYEQVWGKQLSANDQEKKELAKVYLTLVGKYMSLRDNPDIRGDFSRLAHDLLPAADQDAFSKAVSNKVTAASINTAQLATLLGIEGTLLQEAIPFALGEINTGNNLSQNIPLIMDTHLIHNRSFLTDTKVFGFPFHYFYTAVFLKILFCLICLIYCKLIDRIMKKHGMEAANE